MVKTRFSRTWIVIIVSIIPAIIGSIGFPVFLKWNAKHAEEHRNRLPILKQEIEQISIRPGDRFNDEFSGHKSTNAYVAKRFFTKEEWDTLYDYYKLQATKLGWVQSKLENVEEWGTDYGGRLVRFKKGPYVLELFYSGSSPRAPDEYALTVSFGLR